MRCVFFAHYEGAIRTVAGPPMDCASVSVAGHESRRRLEARPRAYRVEAWTGGGWMTGRYVTSATRGTPISGPELLAAMDAAPISRETCDAVLEGMAANETPISQGTRDHIAETFAIMRADEDAFLEGRSDAPSETPPPRTRETIAAEREGHGPFCMEVCCMGTAKDEASE